jgi:predicted nuclease of predicted toxin-antitoxin system
MKFLLDENTEFRVGVFLEEQGHDVTAIAHDYPASISDREVLAIAFSERRILLTSVHDFGELIFKNKLEHAGVVLFRLTPGDIESKQIWLTHLINQYTDQLTNAFFVVTERGVRMRR